MQQTKYLSLRSSLDEIGRMLLVSAGISTKSFKFSDIRFRIENLKSQVTWSRVLTIYDLRFTIYSA
jgi:hypothetical protein